ncbi:MAG: L,D-transpeptidase family protein, partial [Anaerovoracaceae bacterium]
GPEVPAETMPEKAEGTASGESHEQAPELVPEVPEVPAETAPEEPAGTDSDETDSEKTEITTAPAVTVAEATGTGEDEGAAEQPERTEDILSVYPDASDFSPWGRAAAVLLVDAGIVRGDGNGMLNPEKSITRAEFVTMLYRLKDGGNAPSITYEDPELARLQKAGITVNTTDAAAGGPVQASASFSGLPGDLVYDEIWLVDGNPVSGSYKPGKSAASQSTSSMSWTPSYTLHMKTSYRAGVELTWKADGKTYRLYNEKPVHVANYPASHYVTLADGAKVTKIFDTVQSSYKGNRTSAYNPDYTDITKENFVNGKGYSSSTGYLIWANLATQKVNVFQGSKGNWQLIKCFRCASGASASPTPQGVTYVTYKQTGWYTSSYVCKPVVRFYPNSGYAFHSVLYTADGSRIKDGSMGYPVSHGCLRMMPAGIQWLYDNIPVKTTVVIY